MLADFPPAAGAVADSASDGEFIWRDIDTPDGPRRYKLHLPSARDDDGSAPLLVVLHGCTQDPDDIARGTRFNALAAEKGFVVAYPEQPQNRNALKCWNWFDRNHQLRDKGEPAAIASIAEQVISAEHVDRNRVYIAGVSAGGAMALITAYAYPELFAAAGIHSGVAYGAATSIANALGVMHGGASNADLLPSAVVSALGSPRHFPAIIFQGKSDKSVNFVNAGQVVSQLVASFQPAQPVKLSERDGDANGYHFSVRTYGNEHTMIEEWLVDELGHAWSGGSKDGTYADPSGPDASREMMRFFLEHPRS